MNFFLQTLWVYSLINYKPPTYDNGDYQYPTWAHALGWTYTAVSLAFIPIFAIVAIVRAKGNSLGEVNERKSIVFNLKKRFISVFVLQKIRNSIKSDIYECKICGEHHCEHDTPDFESIQEMHTILSQNSPAIILQSPPQGRPYSKPEHQPII